MLFSTVRLTLYLVPYNAVYITVCVVLYDVVKYVLVFDLNMFGLNRIRFHSAFSKLINGN